MTAIGEIKTSSTDRPDSPATTPTNMKHIRIVSPDGKSVSLSVLYLDTYHYRIVESLIHSWRSQYCRIFSSFKMDQWKTWKKNFDFVLEYLRYSFIQAFSTIVNIVVSIYITESRRRNRSSVQYSNQNPNLKIQPWYMISLRHHVEEKLAIEVLMSYCCIEL